MDDQDIGQFDWREIVAILMRRRKVIVAVFVSGVATAALLAALRSPVYQATAKLMVTSQRARITVSPDPKSASTVDRLTDQDLNSEVALLGSPELVREALAAVDDEGGETEPAGWGKSVSVFLSWTLDLPAHLYRSLHGVPPLSRIEEMALAIAPNVEVTPVSKSNLIELSYAGDDPEWVAGFVNRLAERHVARRARINQESETLSFLESQRQLLNQTLFTAEDALAKFYVREGVDPAPDQRVTLRTQVAAAEAALAAATTDLTEGTARAAFLTQEIRSGRAAGLADSPASTDPVQHIRTRIVELQLQRNELLTKFAPTSVKIEEIDVQLEEARRLLAAEKVTSAMGGGSGPLQLELAQTQAQMAALKARIEALRSRLAKDRVTLAHLDQIAPEQQRLEQQVATAKDTFLTYSKKVEEARFSNALDVSKIVNVAVVEKAEVPITPQPSKSGRIILMAAIMSLFAGIALAFARDRLDPAVKNGAEATRATGLPVIADIPL